MQYNIILHITQRNTLFYSVTVPHLFGCGPRKCVPRIFFGEEPFPGSRPWQGMMKTGTDALHASGFGFIIIFPHKNVKTITL